MRVTKEGVGIKQQLITNDVVLLFAVITNPKVPAGTKDAVKNFSFDFSYWSHDVSHFRCMRSFPDLVLAWLSVDAEGLLAIMVPMILVNDCYKHCHCL